MPHIFTSSRGWPTLYLMFFLVKMLGSERGLMVLVHNEEEPGDDNRSPGAPLLFPAVLFVFRVGFSALQSCIAIPWDFTDLPLSRGLEDDKASLPALSVQVYLTTISNASFCSLFFAALLDTHLPIHQQPELFVFFAFYAISLTLLLLWFFSVRANGYISTFLGNRGRRHYSLRLETNRGRGSGRAMKRGKQPKMKPTPQAGATFSNSSLPHIITDTSLDKRQFQTHFFC
jgi:hypothetical protein